MATICDQKIPLYFKTKDDAIDYVTNGHDYYFTLDNDLKDVAIIIITDYFNALRPKIKTNIKSHLIGDADMTHEDIYKVLRAASKHNGSTSLKNNFYKKPHPEPSKYSECGCSLPCFGDWSYVSEGLMNNYNEAVDSVNRIRRVFTVIIMNNVIKINPDNIVITDNMIQFKNMPLRKNLVFASCQGPDHDIPDYYNQIKVKKISPYNLPPIHYTKNIYGYHLTIDAFCNDLIFSTENKGNKQLLPSVNMNNVVKHGYTDTMSFPSSISQYSWDYVDLINGTDVDDFKKTIIIEEYLSRISGYFDDIMYHYYLPKLHNKTVTSLNVHYDSDRYSRNNTKHYYYDWYRICDKILQDAKCERNAMLTFSLKDTFSELQADIAKYDVNIYNAFHDDTNDVMYANRITAVTDNYTRYSEQFSRMVVTEDNVLLVAGIFFELFSLDRVVRGIRTTDDKETIRIKSLLLAAGNMSNLIKYLLSLV